jgi:hypothetical protein
MPRGDVPGLPATLYLEFRRNGNRSRYQDVWFLRPAMLGGLALAECVQGEGRFLDPLANVIWAICEESSWALPAHIGAQRAGVGLPDPSEPIIALFSAETACSLAWVVYLLEDRLDTVSPLICRRVRREIDQRILTPFLARDDFGWLGFHGRGLPKRNFGAIRVRIGATANAVADPPAWWTVRVCHGALSLRFLLAAA